MLTKTKTTPETLRIRREAHSLFEKARAIDSLGFKEKRELTGEEKEQFSKMMADYDAMMDRVDRLEKLASVEDDQEKSLGRDTDDADDSDDKEGEEGDDGDESDRRKPRFQLAKPSKARSGMWDRLSTDEVLNTREAKLLGSKEYRNAFDRYVKTGFVKEQYRDVVLGASGSDTEGGFLALPTQLSDRVVQNLNNLLFFRQLATVETVREAKSLGVRQITTQPSDAAWTTETGTITPDTTMTFGRRDLFPQLVSKYIAISIRTLQAAPVADALVIDRLTYKIQSASESAFWVGTGSAQPLGVFTASASGIPTSQDLVSTLSLANIANADSFIDAVYNIPQQYYFSKAFGWGMHRSVVKFVRTLKDNYGQYLWQMGIQGNRPNQLLDYPVYQSEYCPALNTGSPTASQYIAIVGDFSFYTWAEVVPMGVQRLVELLAGSSEVGFIARYWADGSPVLAPAFTRLQLAAS